MSDKIYLIGNSETYKDYLDNLDNINYLPIENLPIVYFPFEYNNGKYNLNVFSKIINKDDTIIDKIDAAEEYNCDDSSSNAKCSNIEKIYNNIAILEEDWQSYNRNNITIIYYVICVIWLIITFILLKLINIYLNDKYTIFILSSISILIILSLIYGIFLSNTKI